MAGFNHDESLEEFKLRLNSLTEKLNKTAKNSKQKKQHDFLEAKKW